MSNLLQAYYKEPEFVRWIHAQGFGGVTSDNVARYYSLYQSKHLCDTGNCTECAGLLSTWESEADIQRGVLKQVKCPRRMAEEHQTRSREIRMRTEIPKFFRDKTLNDLPLITDEAKAKVTAYIKDFQAGETTYGLYLYARNSGVGRTTCLWHIVKQIIDRGVLDTTPIIMTSMVFATTLQADSYSAGAEFFNQARRTDLLCLDDFGQERQPEWSRARMLAVLENRNWEQRPIIVTSILPFEEDLWPETDDRQLFQKLKKSTTLVELDSE